VPCYAHITERCATPAPIRTASAGGTGMVPSCAPSRRAAFSASCLPGRDL